MKFLVVEDDYITSQVMYELMLAFGNCDIAEDGKQAIELFENSLNNNDSYIMVFLDIMMPEIDGQEVLTTFRKIENEHNIAGLDGVKIIMTTALDDFQNVKTAFKNQADGYLIKPVSKDKIIELMKETGIIAF